MKAWPTMVVLGLLFLSMIIGYLDSGVACLMIIVTLCVLPGPRTTADPPLASHRPAGPTPTKESPTNQDQTITPPRRFVLHDTDGDIIVEGIQWMDGSCSYLIRANEEVGGKPDMDWIAFYAKKHAMHGRIHWLDAEGPCNRQCARCGADSGYDISHCIYCGASPNILGPKWFSKGTMERDKHRTDSLQEKLEELRWLRSQLPIPQEVVATHLKTHWADHYKEIDEPNPWTDDQWSVSIFGTSTIVQADSKEEARRKGATLLNCVACGRDLRPEGPNRYAGTTWQCPYCNHEEDPSDA